MAEFLYFTGPMDCGKSTLALQFAYTHSAINEGYRAMDERRAIKTLLTF